jgi:hypothetical protein
MRPVALILTLAAMQALAHVDGSLAQHGQRVPMRRRSPSRAFATGSSGARARRRSRT